MVLRAAPDPKEATAAVVDGLIRAGGVVVVHGTAARTLCQAVLIAERARRSNGLPASADYGELIAELHAVSATGQTDVRDAPDLPLSNHDSSITVAAAAQRLKLSERHVRRMACTFGGRKLGGRWILDELAVSEYQSGSPP